MRCATCQRKSDRLIQAYRPEAEGALECVKCGTVETETARMNELQREHYGLTVRESREARSEGKDDCKDD